MKCFIIFGLFFLQSCTQKCEPEYVCLLSKTTAQFNQELVKEHQLLPRGFGGSFMHDISKVIQHYLSIQKCEIPEARRLIITCAEKLRKKINDNIKLRAFLHEYPFPPERIEFTIAFVDEKNHHYSDGYVAYAFIQNGKIFYDTSDAKTGKLIAITQEKYEDALRIVQSEKQ